MTGYLAMEQPTMTEEVIEFSAMRSVPAEGARCGVVTCLTCGVGIWVDPADGQDVLEIHSRWHRSLSKRIHEAAGRSRR